MKTTKILSNAVKILSVRGAWTKGNLFEDGQVCAIGAVMKAAHCDGTEITPGVRKAITALTKCLSKKWVADNFSMYDIPDAGAVANFNDAGHRRKGEVIRLFKRAIDMLEREKEAKRAARLTKKARKDSVDGAKLLREIIGSDEPTAARGAQILSEMLMDQEPVELREFIKLVEYNK
jgi:hypothetical protein